MVAFLRLTRFPNLLIVVVTQYLLQYLLLVPIFERNLITPDLDVIHFSLLVLSTVIIAAGGYIINDILDYPIDRINKPNKVIINQQIHIKTAYWYYGTLTLIGFIISLYLAIYVKNLPLLLLYPSAVVLLFLYSKFFKQRVLIGNVIVALFCAFVAGIVWFAERYTFANLMQQNALDGSHVQFLLSLYLIFAFLSTMYREIIKDIEDREGDRVYFCKTLPILYGVTVSKWVAFICGVGLLFFLFLSAIQLIEKQSYIALLFIFFAIVAPLLYSFFKLQQAQSDQAFHQLSRIAKFIMLTGLILLFLI